MRGVIASLGTLWMPFIILDFMVSFSKRSRRWLEFAHLPVGYLDFKWSVICTPLLYLSSLYPRIDECVGNAVQDVGRYDMITHAKSCSLKMFL